MKFLDETRFMQLIPFMNRKLFSDAGVAYVLMNRGTAHVGELL